MRGRPSGLLPLEQAVLEIAVQIDRAGTPFFHGFLAAQTLKDSGFQARLAATGTIYTTLDRLRRAGFLESEWEEAAIAETAGRPRRRLYRITSAGRAALATAARDGAPRTAVVNLAGLEG